MSTHFRVYAGACEEFSDNCISVLLFFNETICCYRKMAHLAAYGERWIHRGSVGAIPPAGDFYTCAPASCCAIIHVLFLDCPTVCLSIREKLKNHLSEIDVTYWSEHLQWLNFLTSDLELRPWELKLVAACCAPSDSSSSEARKQSYRLWLRCWIEIFLLIVSANVTNAEVCARFSSPEQELSNWYFNTMRRMVPIRGLLLFSGNLTSCHKIITALWSKITLSVT